MRDADRIMLERRSFIKCMAAGLTVLPSGFGTTTHTQVSGSAPQSADGWGSQVGFALFTVRDLLAKDREGTMAAIAAMGIKEVQPRTYLELDHGAFRALLDRHGVTCRSTHEFSIPGPGLERDLESLQKIGIRYARFPLPGEPIPGTGRGREAGTATAPAGPGRGRGRGPGGAATMVETPDMMRRTAEDLNRNGRLAAKYGIKALYHNHTTEFQRYPGEPLLPYEILLRETDPALVAMEIDLGWAAIAGADIAGLFKQHPGRFELWHVKDAIGIKHLTPAMNQLERRAAVTLMPVGLGEVDYKTIFSLAGVAGLRHYYIEQDNAAAWGDAMAATRVSVNNLRQLLQPASR
jgi:sugar phosphate isomerase/epimerase